jgi:site-specific DNA recombinase
LTVVEEMDVSGRTPLDRRAGLREAIEAVEDGRADVIVGGYFDRLMRSLKVQAELLERVEAAGGQVLAVDYGQITNGSAAQWISATMLGAAAEYASRSAAERTAEAQARAVREGRWPSPRIPPGYLRGDDGVLAPDPSTSAAVVEAFELRANGATVGAVRAFLAERGVEVSYAAVTRMFKSRVYLGEIHFGDLLNVEAHKATVDAEVWRRAQKAKPSRGRKAKSDRLLARLGVLRCGSCGGRLSASTGHRGTYPIYRCGAHAGDACADRVTVGAEIVEGVVSEAVRRALADIAGRASVETSVADAERELERAEAALDDAIDLLSDLGDRPKARAKLDELTRARDAAEDRVHELGASRNVVMVSADRDWDRLTLDERRALIVATVERATVAPGGRGADHVAVRLFGE